MLPRSSGTVEIPGQGTFTFQDLISQGRARSSSELSGAHEFDRPPTKEEALDRLERTAGPAARKMLEQFLEQVRKVEAKYLEEQSAD